MVCKMGLYKKLFKNICEKNKDKAKIGEAFSECCLKLKTKPYWDPLILQTFIESFSSLGLPLSAPYTDWYPDLLPLKSLLFWMSF